MKLSSWNIFCLCITLTVVLLLQACTGAGEMATNSGRGQEYAKDFESMRGIVKKAVNGSNINIDYITESDNNNMITLSISRERYTARRDYYSGSEKVQMEQGAIRIIKLDDEKTRVEIENPDYHFSVPEHQKEDYQRIIFSRINSLLKKN